MPYKPWLRACDDTEHTSDMIVSLCEIIWRCLFDSQETCPLLFSKQGDVCNLLTTYFFIRCLVIDACLVGANLATTCVLANSSL